MKHSSTPLTVTVTLSGVEGCLINVFIIKPSKKTISQKWKEEILLKPPEKELF